MKLPRPTLSTTVIAVLGAVLPMALFVAALVLTLRQPPPDWAQPPVPEVTAPQAEPTYLELDSPITFGVMGGRIQVSMRLGFSARVAGLELLDLGTRVAERQDAILAKLTEISLDAASATQDSSDLGQELRKILPAPMRTIVNESLATEALPEPVDEVLILDLSIQGG